MLGKLDCYMQKNQTGPLSPIMHKNKFRKKWDLNVRLETIKLLKENRKYIFDINLGCFLRQGKQKLKLKKWEYIKQKMFFIAKGTINKMKRPLTECEKIFTNNMSDKELISKKYKNFILFNITKTFYLLSFW